MQIIRKRRKKKVLSKNCHTSKFPLKCAHKDPLIFIRIIMERVLEARSREGGEDRFFSNLIRG